MQKILFFFLVFGSAVKPEIFKFFVEPKNPGYSIFRFCIWVYSSSNQTWVLKLKSYILGTRTRDKVKYLSPESNPRLQGFEIVRKKNISPDESQRLSSENTTGRVNHRSLWSMRAKKTLPIQLRLELGYRYFEDRPAPDCRTFKLEYLSSAPNTAFRLHIISLKEIL